ncbi:MAG: type II secretion system protein N [Cellvibrionaceae bacterium]
MKKISWIILLGALWLVLIFRSMPAQWGVWLANTPAQMEGVSGTIWSGRAENVVLPYDGGVYALGELTWKLKPLSLLTLSPCATVTTKLSSQTVEGIACSGITGNLTLKDLEINLPAAAAEMWAPVSVQGDIFLQIESLKMSGDKIKTLNGKGSWTGARYHNSQTWMSLGAIAFELSGGKNGSIAAKVFDLEGPLELDLQSQFNLTGDFDIRGDIILRQNAPQEIAQLLMIIAKEIKEGHFKFEWISG